MHRKYLSYCRVFLGFFLLAFVIARTTRPQGSSRKAFMTFEIERHFDATGVERSSEYKTFAVRSDGSSAWYSRREAPDGSTHTSGAIYDVPSARVISVDGFTDSISTESLTAAELSFRKSVDNGCQSGKEHSNLLGFDVVKVTQPLPPALPTEITEWRAPALNCYSLSGTAVFHKNGQLGPKTEREVLYVIPGEPPSSLFVVPPGYSERSPSQISDEFARRYGHAPFSANVLDRAQGKYQERHK